MAYLALSLFRFFFLAPLITMISALVCGSAKRYLASQFSHRYALDPYKFMYANAKGEHGKKSWITFLAASAVVAAVDAKPNKNSTAAQIY